MKELHELPTSLELDACQACPDAGRPRTMYVHFCSGLVTEVGDVTELHVTGTHLILLRGAEPQAAFARRDVYFACCEPGQQPAPC